MDFIRTLIQKKCALPVYELEAFEKLLEVRNLKKKEEFQATGEDVDFIGFVESGVFKHSYTDSEGRELIKNFSGPGEIICSYGDFLNGNKSRTTISAVTEAKILQISTVEFLRLFNKHPMWEKFGRKIAEEMFLAKEAREYELLVCTPAENYKNFLSKNQTISKEIPDYMIASFLGVTPVYLSRIRKQMELELVPSHQKLPLENHISIS